MAARKAQAERALRPDHNPHTYSVPTEETWEKLFPEGLGMGPRNFSSPGKGA